MSLFHKLIPKFLIEERLCWLKAPLYKVEKGKEKHYFYSDEELNNSKIKGEITRFKGLGQMNASDTKESMFNEERQRLEILIPDQESLYSLELLMGKDVEPRRNFVFSNIDFSKLEV